MANVTYRLLNQRQINNLVNLNNELALSGKLNRRIGLKTPGTTSVSGYYKRCARCDQLGLSPYGINRIEDFRFHGSSSTGCSTYCNSCIASGLTVVEAQEAKFIMDEYEVEPQDGELVLRYPDGTWKKASEVSNAAEVLADSLFYYYTESTDLMSSNVMLKVSVSVVLLGILAILGYSMWGNTC